MAFYGKTSGEWQKLSSLDTNKEVSITTGEGGSTGTIRRILPDGSAEDWTNTNTGDSINDLDTDSSLNVYSASNDGTVRKFDSSGVEQWQFTKAVNFSSIAVSDSGGVYAGDDSGDISKINKQNGNGVWTFTGHGSTVNGVYADKSGNVYSAAADNTVRKIDSQGNEMWVSNEFGRTINGVVSGGGSYAYGAGFDSIKKIAPGGSQSWSVGTGSTANDLDIDENTGAVYVADGGGNIQKIENETGNIDFSESVSTGSLNSISVDKNGNIYAGSDEPNLLKLEDTGSSFNEIWSYTTFGNTVQATSIKIIT
jgi:streptogramin lyase